MARESKRAREREQEDEASSRQLPPLELQPNRHWPLHESVQGSQHLPEGDHRGGPQQDRHPRLDLPKGGQDYPLSIIASFLKWRAGWQLGAMMMTGQHMSRILSNATPCHLFQAAPTGFERARKILDMASALSQTCRVSNVLRLNSDQESVMQQLLLVHWPETWLWPPMSGWVATNFSIIAINHCHHCHIFSRLPLSLLPRIHHAVYNGLRNH